jgi:type IV secretory pathway VirB2 component (pilin)
MKKLPSFATKVIIFTAFFLTIAPTIAPVLLSDAFAGTFVEGDPNANILVDSMCNALQIVTGNGGKAFAAFAIISVGIGFFTGKVSWGLMIGVAMGIAAMFGAPTIVAALSGEDSYDCGN